MLGRLVGWFGKNFFAGSGYEKRLHEELIGIKKEMIRNNSLLQDIKSELTNANKGKKRGTGS